MIALLEAKAAGLFNGKHVANKLGVGVLGKPGAENLFPALQDFVRGQHGPALPAT